MKHTIPALLVAVLLLIIGCANPLDSSNDEEERITLIRYDFKPEFPNGVSAQVLYTASNGNKVSKQASGPGLVRVLCGTDVTLRLVIGPNANPKNFSMIMRDGNSNMIAFKEVSGAGTHTLTTPAFCLTP